MSKETHPLAEIFGFPAENSSQAAQRYRSGKLCPFNNKVPNCTKDKANDPLGVCSIFHDGKTAITCPVRFREDWIITIDSAGFFFSADTHWTSLTEVQLRDRNGKSAGNIDIVLVAYDRDGQVVDFGAIEIQGVYISGNIRRPFEAFMKEPSSAEALQWRGEKHYPRPDYLSSSRKRLAPQLLYKGGILHRWKKKTAVVLDHGFFESLPKLQEVPKKEADIAWLIYDLMEDPQTQRFRLTLTRTVYTRFTDSLAQITVSEAGEVDEFVSVLQNKLDDKLNSEPVNQTLDEIL
jgi:hypothetical protein